MIIKPIEGTEGQRQSRRTFDGGGEDEGTIIPSIHQQNCTMKVLFAQREEAGICSKAEDGGYRLHKCQLEVFQVETLLKFFPDPSYRKVTLQRLTEIFDLEKWISQMKIIHVAA